MCSRAVWTHTCAAVEIVVAALPTETTRLLCEGPRGWGCRPTFTEHARGDVRPEGLGIEVRNARSQTLSIATN